MSTSSVVVDGITYYPAPDRELKIVVLQRGNVLAGHLAIDGDMCTLTDAQVIRRWGTTKGLGQLAADGPQPSTVLDPCGTVTFHILTAVMMIDVTSDRW